MPSPFPGMDPFLEDPDLWPAVHTNLIVTLQDVLAPLLRPRYYVRVELRVYDEPLDVHQLVGIGDVAVEERRRTLPGTNGAGSGRAGIQVAAADGDTSVLTVQVPRIVEVRERYLEVRRPQTHEVITVIEVLSPTDKRPGRGRRQYEQKRMETVSTLTNLVEIDLLRAYEPLPLLHQGALLDRAMTGDYRVLVSRGHRHHEAILFAIDLRQPLPVVPIPLRPEDTEPQIDLQQVIQTVYDRGSFDLTIDYRQEPIPPLPPDDAAWADALLRSQGLR